MVTAATSTIPVTMYFDAASEALEPHAVVDGGDDEATQHRVDRLAPSTEQAGAADDRGGDRVQHELAPVEVRRDRAQPRRVHDARRCRP